MLAKDEQVVVKMRLARREIPSREARGRGNQLNGAVRPVFPRNEFVFVRHIPSSDTRVDRARFRSRGRCQTPGISEWLAWLRCPGCTKCRWVGGANLQPGDSEFSLDRASLRAGVPERLCG